jgi:hypothetical protein
LNAIVEVAGSSSSALVAHAQEPVSQATVDEMSYAYFAIAPSARPDASASANSAKFLAIKLPIHAA